jgi:predicted nucleotidyltransferase
MLRQESLLFICATAQEYGVKRVLLFGSCLNTPEEKTNDIDLAVEGLSRRDYRRFWNKLLWADELKGKSVDVVRIEENGFLVPIILDEGREIYVEREP